MCKNIHLTIAIVALNVAHTGGAAAQDDTSPQGASGAVITKEPNPAAKKKPTPPVSPPKLMHYAAPVYPPAAKEGGIEGEVILKLVVDDDGKVVDVAIFAAGGHGFDEAAVAAAKNLRFGPARTAEGNPVKVRIRFRYAFELTEVPKEPAPKATLLGVIEGTVVIAASDDGLVGATVTIVAADGEQQRMISDAYGEFRFMRLPAGQYQVRIEADGFEPQRGTETVRDGEAIVLRYLMGATIDSGVNVIEVDVVGKRPSREVVRRTLTKEEIEFMPGTRGDALKSLQSMPGVARPPFILGLLIVRGSAPEDTLTFIDGVGVPLIYHFGGLSSVVPTEVLEKIDFYPGNFSAKYGRAMGGIVDVGLRDPKDDGYHGLAQLDLIDARLMLEGPVPFADDWSFLIAGRRSWMDAWLGPVLESAGAGVTQAPRYYDYQFVTTYRPSTDKKLRFTFYGSDDAFEVLGDVEDNDTGVALHTAFQRATVMYESRVSPSNTLKWTMAFGHDDLDFNFGKILFDINTYRLSNRFEHTYRFEKYLTINSGLDIVGGMANLSALLPADQGGGGGPAGGGGPQDPFSTPTLLQIQTSRAFSRPGVYVEAEIVPLEGLRIVPGLRADYDMYSGALDVAPRLSTQYAIHSEFPMTTIKAGVGLYYQPPQPQELIEPFGTPGLSSERAVHVGAGVEQDITEQLEISGEFFYKDLDNLIVAGDVERYTNGGRGYAVGGEFLLKYKPDDRFYGWAAYTVSRSIRQDGPDEETYLASYDQTHNLTVLGSFKLGSGWTVGARFRMVSGSLVTPVTCDPEDDDCDGSRTTAIYDAITASYSPLAGATSSERLPLFHQLDLRVDKKWQFDDWSFSAYLDIMNVYNNQTEESVTYNFNYTQRDYVLGLPILPSIGLKGQL